MDKERIVFVIADDKVEDFFNKTKDTHAYEKLMERCKYIRSKVKRKETCRERLKREHPTKVDEASLGGCCGCPGQYGYVPWSHHFCYSKNNTNIYYTIGEQCRACWDQEVEKEN